MAKLSRAFFAALLIGAVASPAVAQTADEQIEALVRAWIVEQIPEFAAVVHDYGAACLTPRVAALPEAAKQTIIAAGGMEAGLAALQGQDPALVDAFLPTLGECIDTLYIGDQIWAWIGTQQLTVGVTPEAAATCLMTAVQPLAAEAKEIIYAAPDFQVGAQNLILTRPDLAPGLAAQLGRCL